MIMATAHRRHGCFPAAQIHAGSGHRYTACGEAEQTPAGDTPTELAVMYLLDDLPANQRVFRSRRALETIDPREFLRQP